MIRVKHFFFQIFGKQAKFVGKLLLLLLVSNFVLRLVFFSYHLQGGWKFSAGEVIQAFLVGIRFDLATLAITTGIFLLLLSLPISFLQSIKAKKWISGILLCFHFGVMFLNAGDVAYFGFSSKRSSHELFTGGKDLLNFGFSDMLPYWWLFLVVFALLALQFRIVWRILANEQKKPPAKEQSKILAWLFPIVLAGLLFLSFRGGWQHRPLRPADAFVTSSTFLGNVALNSAYTVLMSLDLGNEADVELMPHEEAVRLAQELVRNDFDGEFENPDYPLLRKTHFDAPEQKYNVVILILESFNAGKVGSIQGLPISESKTPNFDLLAQKGRLFTNFFSNGSRSIQSLPAIFNSIPEIFERPLIGSSFETNQQWGLGNMLAQRGYANSFVCGGPNGTMGFDAYCKVAGIDDYYGWSDFPKDRQAPASKWGIHDHAMLEWLAQLQNGFPKPFLNVWFSISNHHPFVLPDDCPEEIRNAVGNDMDRTVRYTDWALGEYFAAIEQTEWAKNTIFVLTGDHCFYFPDDPDRGDIQNFHVPLLLLGPGVTPGVDARPSGHLSILPTLIELLKLNTAHSSAGVSLFSQKNSPYNVTNLMGIRAMARGNGYVSTNLEALQTSFQLKADKWEQDLEFGASEEGKKMVESLKAIYQISSFMRKYNRLSMPNPGAQ